MPEGESAPQTRAAARAQRETAEPSAPAPKRRFRWVRSASDRVPTAWLTGAATVLFLGATAAFGGMATAAEPGIATIGPGTEHRNAQFAFTIENAQLRDEEPDAAIYLDEGERMLTVRVRVENLWTQPQSASELLENITIAELDPTKTNSVRRVDDTTFVSRLQPNVPAEIEFRWKVEDWRFEDGQKLHLTLNDLSLYTGSFVATGSWWSDPIPVAEMTVTVDDTGVTP